MARIRPTALGCFMRNGSELLVVHGFDAHQQMAFFRFAGGGIEFGETGEQAVRREIHEELGQEIRIVRHLGYFESIFDYDGAPLHQIEQVFLAEFIDPAAYQRDRFEVTENYEGRQNPIASWISMEEFRSGRKILYPPGALEAIDRAPNMPQLLPPHAAPLSAPVLLSAPVAEALLSACAGQGARKFLVDHLVERGELLTGGCFEFSAEDVNRYVLSPEISLAVGKDHYPETCHYHTIKTEIYIGDFYGFAMWKLGRPETAIIRGDFDGVVIIPPNWCHLMKPKPLLTWTMQFPNPEGTDKHEAELPADIAVNLQ